VRNECGLHPLRRVNTCADLPLSQQLCACESWSSKDKIFAGRQFTEALPPLLGELNLPTLLFSTDTLSRAESEDGNHRQSKSGSGAFARISDVQIFFTFLRQ
jgi:hypothetical protein